MSNRAIRDWDIIFLVSIAIAEGIGVIAQSPYFQLAGLGLLITWMVWRSVGYRMPSNEPDNLDEIQSEMMADKDRNRP